MNFRKPVLISLFAVLTAAGAYIVIPVPYSPVPVTFQTMFCILSGMIIGPVSGASSQFIYILLGVAGLPVFARGGSGPAILIGPTGGYIIGFIPAAFLAGFLTDKRMAAAGMISAVAVIYSLGIVQLMAVTGLSLPASLAAGLVPFIAADAVKIIVGYGIYRSLSRSGFLYRKS